MSDDQSTQANSSDGQTGQAASNPSLEDAPKTRSCKRHTGYQTRLACSTCDDPICPKCMIQAEVGFKCPICVKGTRSHVLEVGPKAFLMLGVLSVVAMIPFNLLYSMFVFSMPFRFFGVSLIGLLLLYLLGQACGRAIRSLVGYKRGIPVLMMVTLGAIVGLMGSPLPSMVVTLIEMSKMYPDHIQDYLTYQGMGIMIILAAFSCYLNGLQAPFKGKA